MFNSIKLFAVGHKLISGLVILGLVGGGWWAYAKFGGETAQTRYVLAAATKSTIISAISGTGQVASNDQTDLKSKASGEIVSLRMANGQAVKAGDLLAQIDTKDALKAVRDAETSLETARLSLEKLLEPPDALALLQSRNSLAQAKEAKKSHEDDLKKSYDDGFTDVANAFLNLPATMTGLESILFGYVINGYQWNVDAYADLVKQYDERIIIYRNDAMAAQEAARAAFDKNMASYKASGRDSSTTEIEALLAETYATSKALAEAVKDASNLVDFVNDILTTRNLKVPTTLAVHRSSLSGYTGTLNGNLSTLLGQIAAIADAKSALVNDDRSIEEKTQSLAKLEKGPDALDIRSQQITVQQRQNTLTDARLALADYAIRAPFDGIIASVKAKKGDSASPGTILATLLGNGQMAEITLNEVDVANIKTEQKATLTFDAIEDISLTGRVADIDTLGTVSQGVVNYTVKIVFDTKNDRIKSGMSVSAAIVTGAKPDVLAVPNAAVKTQNGQSYVEILDTPIRSTGNSFTSAASPTRVNVGTGMASDTLTEITEGLNEGDMIITQTIAASASGAAAAQTGLRIPGFGGGSGGGAFRR
ncbi:MAG: efflux RND transporter periplasmic adaptor subunit [bacterium]|nr:efflux RND transporter periplasmic adaptor subunit [bacterium]